MTAQAMTPASYDLWVRPAANDQSSLELHVPGIHCAGCIRRIEDRIGSLPGVSRARVSFTTRRLSVIWATGLLAASDIVAALTDLGFEARPFTATASDDSASAASRELLRCMAVAGFAAMNIMLLSVSVWSGADGPTRDLFHALSALIAIPAIGYSGRPFFRSAIAVLRRGRTNMDVPICIGVLLATLMSIYETLSSADHAYFDGAVMLLFFLLVGRYLDSVMRLRARAGVAQLLKQMPAGALVEHADGRTEYRPIEDIAPGMRLIVAAGERIPVDAVVLTGHSSIDRSLVTGESLPVSVSPDTTLLAGALNLDAPLTVKATHVGESSFLASLIRLMEAAEQGRSRYVQIADRASRLYAPAVHSLAALTALGWLLTGHGWHAALTAATAVLIITCPCALGLAVPAVQVRAAGILMRRGILVKDGSALERMAEVDCVFFDKTGTLTLGRPQLIGDTDFTPDQAAVALALAQRSTHPLSRALAGYLQAQAVRPASLADIREVPGMGVEARVDGAMARIGRPSWLGIVDDAGVSLSLGFQHGDGNARLLRFADSLRADAAASVARLARLGLPARILSGDAAPAVQAVAADVAIADWQAGMLPGEKVAAVETAKAAGHKPLMVGDGLNDGPALSAGHASMAPSSASDVGQSAADLVFLGDGLTAVPEAVALSRAAMRHVRQNFALAIGYNVLAVPIAIVGLATPLIAALAMSTSSIIVIANALRLRERAAAA